MHTEDRTAGSDQPAKHESDRVLNMPIVLAIEGRRDNLELQVVAESTPADVIASVRQVTGISAALSVFLENGDAPLSPDKPLAGQLPAEFVVLHVATSGKIHVEFTFNGPPKAHDFLPSATILTLTAWAIGPEGFGLAGSVSDYQLKHAGVVLEPDMHLGQVVTGKKEVALDLVMKVKPQG